MEPVVGEQQPAKVHLASASHSCVSDLWISGLVAQKKSIAASSSSDLSCAFEAQVVSSVPSQWAVEPHVVGLAPSHSVDVVDRGAVCLERARLSAPRAAVPLGVAVRRQCSRAGPRVLQHAGVGAEGLRAEFALVFEVRVLDLLLEV